MPRGTYLGTPWHNMFFPRYDCIKASPSLATDINTYVVLITNHLFHGFIAVIYLLTFVFYKTFGAGNIL